MSPELTVLLDLVFWSNQTLRHDLDCLWPSEDNVIWLTAMREMYHWRNFFSGAG